MGANCPINVPVKVVFNPRSKAALQRNILMVYEYLNTYEVTHFFIQRKANNLHRKEKTKKLNDFAP